MTLFRLTMIEKGQAFSSKIPSSSISSVMWALSQNPDSISSLWDHLKDLDRNLKTHFISNQDSFPLLEGIGDGLVVISWDYKCIESFQVYQPLARKGKAYFHNGESLEESKEPLKYEISYDWRISDFHFGDGER